MPTGSKCFVLCCNYYYLGNLNSLPRLSLPQLIKLKHLTILTLAARNRVSKPQLFIYYLYQTLPYATLLEELDVTNVRELEVRERRKGGREGRRERGREGGRGGGRERGREGGREIQYFMIGSSD